MNLRYREKLLHELNQRKARNPAFSLRAFSRQLGISTATLSQVLSGKRDLSKKNAIKVAERLQLTPVEFEIMMREISGKPDHRSEELAHLQLEEDRFRTIADWFHFALLSLARLKGIRADENIIASRLGISQSEALEAINRLVRLQLIAVENGMLRRTAASIMTSRDRPSASLRRHHRQMLERATLSLEEVPIEFRDISSVTMAIDINKFSEAKDCINKFKLDMARLLEQPNPNAVYNLGINLFPLSRMER